MSVVVHHGGSGTTHSAARAGVPSVVVPFAGDQFFWADRLQQAGIATRLPGWHALDASTLAQNIKLASSDQMRSNAHAMGERMRAEDGLTSAVGTIEQLMAHH
jgi:sterol 3beta-glucosyltransferase